MNEALKQRIVGTIVLMAVAGIFMPMFLEFESPHTVDTSSRIPPQPRIEPVQLPEPVRPVAVEPPKSVEQAFLPAATQPPEEADEVLAAEAEIPAAAEGADEQPVPARLTPEGIPEAWVIQVGSFREQARAEVLVGNLLKDGYKAYIRSHQSGGAALHRVFVGPDVLKANTLADKKAIDRKYGVKSIVLQFEP